MLPVQPYDIPAKPAPDMPLTETPEETAPIAEPETETDSE